MINIDYIQNSKLEKVRKRTVEEYKLKLKYIDEQSRLAKKYNLVQKKPKNIKKGDVILLQNFVDYNRRDPYYKKYVRRRLYLTIKKIEISKAGRWNKYWIRASAKSGTRYTIALSPSFYYWVKK